MSEIGETLDNIVVERVREEEKIPVSGDRHGKDKPSVAGTHSTTNGREPGAY